VNSKSARGAKLSCGARKVKTQKYARASKFLLHSPKEAGYPVGGEIYRVQLALLEELRRKFVEVLPPVHPGVGTGGFLVNNIEAVFLEHFDCGF
jgi:hypothetical protein